jgi:hypothetical protein
VTSPAWPTESTRLRDAAPDAVPGPVSVLRLLGSARPADVPAVLAVLAPDQLAEAVAAVDLPLAPAVAAHISQHGPAQARRTLARRLVQQPEHVPARPLTLDRYLRVLGEAAAAGYRDQDVDRIRAVALEALCAGSLSAEQVVEHTRPAALALALAASTPADQSRPGARRATGDVRVLVARRLGEAFGADDGRWAAAIMLSGGFGGFGGFRGSLPELVERVRAEPAEPADRVDLGDSSGCADRSTHSDHAAQNVLLALAPRTVATRYLAGPAEPATAFRPRARDHHWEWMLTSGPLSRPLVDHVLAHGTAGQRRNLIGNKLCPDSVLEQALPGHTREILLRATIPPHVRAAAFRTFEREPREARLWARGLAGDGRDQLIDLAWDLTDRPSLLRQVVSAVLTRADPATLTCLYGALAEAAGPEPVWALELERTESLDAALPQVRDSMAACSAEPLVDAARQTPRRHWIDALEPEAFGGQLLRADAELDRVGHFPLEALVAAHLDGRPERWREVARRLAAGAAPVTSVIAAVAALPAASALTP